MMVKTNLVQAILLLSAASLASAIVSDGGSGPDTMIGTSGNDIFRGFGGNDKIYGRGGDDILEASGGDDLVIGSDGEDYLTGGAGNDRLSGGPGLDEIYGGVGADLFILGVNMGVDTIDDFNPDTGDILCFEPGIVATDVTFASGSSFVTDVSVKGTLVAHVHYFPSPPSAANLQFNCRAIVGGGGDPFMGGFQGQNFFFDGEDAKWYSAISDPSKKLILNMRMAHHKSFGFMDGIGIVLQGSDGVDHTIALTVVVAKDDFSPTCDSDSDVCLGEGAIAFEIDGKVVKEPGHMVVEEGVIEILAVNAPFGCQRIPDAHYHWEEQVAHAKEMRLQEDETKARRKLQAKKQINTDVLSRLIDPTVAVFNEGECAEWVEDRLVEGNVYEQAGSLSTVFIETPVFSLRVEYTRNDNTATWVAHHRLDWFLGGYHSFQRGAGGVRVGGVLGETGKIKLDKTDLPIKGDRLAVLSHAKDSDYEVDGPYGDQFVAKP